MSVSLFSQSKETNFFKIIGNDFKTSFDDGVCVFSSPFRFSSADWIKTGAVIMVTGALMPLDKDISKEFAKNHNDTKNKIESVGNGYGNLITPVVLGGGIYSYGLFFKDEYVRETGRMIFESVLFSGIITTVTKTVAGRSRPNSERGPYFYNMFTLNEGSLSFPSGHSTVAFAVSSVLANRIHNIYATIGLYSLSTVAALSRIYSDKHWASDVVLGSAIGYFVGDYISSDKRKCCQNKKVTYNIYPSANGIGMQVCF
jgi:hypothetical protein